jgi:hypothetical protein
VKEIRYSKMVKIKVGHFMRCLGRQRVEVEVSSNPFVTRD